MRMMNGEFDPRILETVPRSIPRYRAGTVNYTRSGRQGEGEGEGEPLDGETGKKRREQKNGPADKSVQLSSSPVFSPFPPAAFGPSAK